jgi:putative membrane protein
MIEDFSWTQWGLALRSSHTVLLLGGAYFLLAGPLRRSFGRVEVRKGQALAFSVGLLALLIVLVTPWATLSTSYLLTAHMVQVIVITMVAAPLLLIGTPAWMLRPLFKSKLADRLMRMASKPIVCFAAFNAVLVLMHYPPIYDRVIGNEALYHIEHWVYLAAAILLWWPLLSPLEEYPRLSYAGQMLYLVINTSPSAILGIAITFADSLLYSLYEAAPSVWGLSHKSDQKVAGLIMWVGGGTFFLLVLTAVFFIWADREEQGTSKEPGI